MSVQLPDTLPGRLAGFATSKPDAVALREKDLGIWRETTWRQYFDETAAVGRMLWELGIRGEDHVAILSENRTEWLYADLGAQGIGARSVGIYQTNPPADVAYILNHCKARVLFCEDQEQVDKAVAVADETPSVEHVVVFDPRGTRGYSDSRLMHWSDFIERGHQLMRSEPAWYTQQLHLRDPKQATMVVYTSGTTGNPKGALLSSRNALAGSEAALKMLQLTADDFVLSYFTRSTSRQSITDAQSSRLRGRK